jgi:hypothetical protein
MIYDGLRNRRIFFSFALSLLRAPDVLQKVVIDLENSKRADHLARHNVVTDVEVKERASVAFRFTARIDSDTQSS